VNHFQIALPVLVTFLLVVYCVAMYWAWRGDALARYFIWIWATGLIVAMLFKLSNQASIISNIAAGIMLAFCLFVFYLIRENISEKLNISHAETRKVLDESNRRIDEELKTIARRLHDEVNPSLLISAKAIKGLEKHLVGNEKAIETVRTVSEMLNQAYNHARDIIKNTRIEIIDSIGLTAALESLISHFSILISKTSITLKHNLPSRPAMDSHQAAGLYKIIREAVLNSIKHSNASSIIVNINQAGDLHYEVSIIDNGLGINHQPAGDDSSGIGLLDMRERVRALGGTLKIQITNPSDNLKPGTTISFTFYGRAS